MSRSNQLVGLTDEARQFLLENEIEPDICECCKRPFPRELEQISSVFGYWDEEFPLHRHFLKNGTVANEFHQETVYSSGPIIFIGLKCDDREFLWSQDDINKAYTKKEKETWLFTKVHLARK